MPAYLLHGFRWPRPLIRIHIILQNLDDAAAEWLMAHATTECLIENFEELYPKAMANLPDLRFIEQYDPLDESPSAGSQPYAYVADVMHEIKLGLAVDDAIGKGISGKQWDALLELRDRLAPGEKVGWYVVLCGDEERLADQDEEDETMSDVTSEEIEPPRIPSPNVSRKPVPIAKDKIIADRRDLAGQSRTSDSTTRSGSTAADSIVRDTSSRADSALGRLILEQRQEHSSGSNMSKGSSGRSEPREYGSPASQPKGFKKLVGSLKKRAR